MKNIKIVLLVSIACNIGFAYQRSAILIPVDRIEAISHQVFGVLEIDWDELIEDSGFLYLEEDGPITEVYLDDGGIISQENIQNYVKDGGPGSAKESRQKTLTRDVEGGGLPWTRDGGPGGSKENRQKTLTRDVEWEGLPWTRAPGPGGNHGI